MTVIEFWPALRAEFAAFAWWMMTPHRVRTGMAQAWIHSRDGKIPIIVRTARQPFGERVHIWCRAGTSAEDFSLASHLIAAACWAREVRVYRSHRYAQVVVLDVIRRRSNQLDQSEPGWRTEGTNSQIRPCPMTSARPSKR